MSRRVTTASTGLLSVMLGTAIVAGAADGSPSQLRLAMCDYAYGRTHDAIGANPDLVGSRFSIVIRDAPYDVDLARLRRDDPDLTVLAYHNLGILPFQFCSPPADPILPAMFLTDPDNGYRLRIDLPLVGKTWIMDPGSAEWISLAVDVLTPLLATGYDGVFLDDVWSDLLANRPLPRQYGFDCSYGLQYPAYPGWIGALNYLERVQDALTDLGAAVAPAPVVFNGLNDFPLVRETRFLPIAAGAALEAPVYRELFTPDAPFRTGQSWRLAMQPLFDVQSEDTVIWLGLGSPDAVEGRMYALASYLLGANSNSAFYFTADCATLSYFPEWDVPVTLNLNRPSSIDQLWDPARGVYVRELADVLVMVDPRASGEPITVPVEPPMCRVTPSGGLAPIAGGSGHITLEEVSEVVIGPHQGVLLVAGPCTAPPRRPQTRVAETE